jgi:hypothetical protein
VYDDKTRIALTARYGPERAANIIAGTDAATNADLAAWRRLCASGEPLDKRFKPESQTDKIKGLYRYGVEIEAIAERFGMKTVEIKRIVGRLS